MDIFDTSEGEFKPQPTTVQCECRSQYVLGDPESTCQHAEDHARWEMRSAHSPVCACGMTIALDDWDHDEFHERWDYATAVLGYIPAGIEATSTHENMKDAGRQIIASAGTNDALIAGSELVVRAYFDRSLWKSIDRDDWRDHPTFAQYVGMADLAALVGRVATAMRTKYPHVPPTGILDGKTNWMPYETLARALEGTE